MSKDCLINFQFNPLASASHLIIIAEELRTVYYRMHHSYSDYSNTQSIRDSEKSILLVRDKSTPTTPVPPSQKCSELLEKRLARSIARMNRRPRARQTRRPRPLTSWYHLVVSRSSLVYREMNSVNAARMLVPPLQCAYPDLFLPR